MHIEMKTQFKIVYFITSHSKRVRILCVRNVYKWDPRCCGWMKTRSQRRNSIEEIYWRNSLQFQAEVSFKSLTEFVGCSHLQHKNHHNYSLTEIITSTHKSATFWLVLKLDTLRQFPHMDINTSSISSNDYWRHQQKKTLQLDQDGGRRQFSYLTQGIDADTHTYTHNRYLHLKII